MYVFMLNQFGLPQTTRGIHMHLFAVLCSMKWLVTEGWTTHTRHFRQHNVSFLYRLTEALCNEDYWTLVGSFCTPVKLQVPFMSVQSHVKIAYVGKTSKQERVVLK